MDKKQSVKQQQSKFTWKKLWEITDSPQKGQKTRRTTTKHQRSLDLCILAPKLLRMLNGNGRWITVRRLEIHCANPAWGRITLTDKFTQKQQKLPLSLKLGE